MVFPAFFSLLFKISLIIEAHICFRIAFSDSIMNYMVSIIFPIGEEEFFS